MLRRLAPALHPGTPILSLVKGIEEGSHARMSQVIADELPGRPVAVLSGPNLAREIAAGKPAGSVVASEDAALADTLKQAWAAPFDPGMSSAERLARLRLRTMEISRANDPAALKAWYRDHLGVGGGCGSDETGQPNDWLWFTQGGPMVFEPFKADTDYFAADKAFMINLRVSDLDGLLAKLAAAGIEAITKPEWDEPTIGRFARIHDPEGLAIELWQPPTGQ